MFYKRESFLAFIFSVWLTLGLVSPVIANASIAEGHDTISHAQGSSLSHGTPAWQLDDCADPKASLPDLEAPSNESYWWTVWKGAEWISDPAAAAIPPNITKPQASGKPNGIYDFQYPPSIRNESSSTLGGVTALDVGGTSGQPADWWNPALPKFPNFEGHYFPKLDHSKLRFQIYTAGEATLDIVINCVLDHYARYFYIRCDGVLIYSAIISSSGFNGEVCFLTTGGSHRLEFEIYWGGYSDYGWELVYFWPYAGALHQAQNIQGEYFPQQLYARLRYLVECGDDTVLNINLQRVDDITSRLFSVYLDGNLVVPETVVSSAHSFELNIGSYAVHSNPDDPIGIPTMHELKLQIRWGDYCAYGWRVNLLAVHYKSVFVEVDWMGAAADGSCAGHCPPNSVLEYIAAYYKTHGYERVTFEVTQTGVPHTNYVSPDSMRDYWIPNYFNHRDTEWTHTENWRYVLFGHSGSGQYSCFCGGYHHEAPYIADWDLWVLAGLQPILHEYWRRTALMHEFGHAVGILAWDYVNNREIYCANLACCMSGGNPLNAVYEPWYCGFHWSLREDPLWPLAWPEN